MRMSLILPVAAALAVAAIGISSPAPATTLKEALKICNKSGSCTVHGSRGGANIKYGNHEIWCPYGGGQCTCLTCGRTQVPGSVKVGGGVLASPSGGAGSWTSSGGVFAPKSGGAVQKTKHKPEPKPAPTAEPKSTPTVPRGSWSTTTTTIPAKPAVRDHRVTPKVGDDRSSAGVTTTRYGYDGAKKASGRGPSEARKPEIRDHRGVDPASRSGASDSRKPKIRDHRAETTSNDGTNAGPRPAKSVTP